MRYRATTSACDQEGNLTYNGKTYGIRFENGVAMFDDLTVGKNNLGFTAEEIAVKLEKDFGYKVERLNEDGTPFEPEVSEKPKPSKAEA